MKPIIRKEIVIVDEIRKEMDKQLEKPLRKCASIVVIENVYAGRYVEDLALYAEYGSWLGKVLIDAAMAKLGVGAEMIDSYGKAAVVGVGGELEQGSALLHMAFDGPVRAVLSDSKSIIPSAEKVGSAGCSVDVPLHHKKALKIRTHYDCMEVSVADSPRPGEIMLALCLATGPRPFARVGGLLLENIKGENGLD